MASRTAIKPRILLDTGVVSRFALLRPSFVKAFEEIAETRKMYITFATRLELYEWVRQNQQQLGGAKALAQLNNFLESLPLWVHTQDITRQALALGQRVQHIGVADYVNAATALVGKCPIFTLNLKHYKAAKVKLYEPPGFDFVKESGGANS